MVNSLQDAKRAFFMAQIPGATNQMAIADLETIFFSNPSAYLKGSAWTEDEIGLKAWTYDPIITSTGAAVTNGLLYLTRMKLRKDASVTGIALAIQTAGTTLVAGQNFAGLWRANGALVGVTADQAAAWAVTGYKAAALVGGPYALVAGDYYGGIWANGGGPPGFFRNTNPGPTLNNGQLAAPNLRQCSADTALTTTAPNPFGAQTPLGTTPWFGLY